MTHTQRVIEQLRIAEEDEAIPSELQEQCREQREELEGASDE